MQGCDPSFGDSVDKSIISDREFLEERAAFRVAIKKGETPVAFIDPSRICGGNCSIRTEVQYAE